MTPKIHIAALMAAACASAWGAPSRMRPVAVTAPSGETVEVIPLGDEHSRHYVDKDGTPVSWLASAGSAKLSAAMKKSVAVGTPAHRGTRFPTSGHYPFLVVLVEFPDARFSAAADIRSEFDAMLNRPGYDGFNATGSAADYYLDCSDGKFQPVFETIGPVMLSQEYSYYGSGSDDSRAGLMVLEACRAIDSQTDFSRYDLDGDGEVDNVYFFYAGKGEADGGDPATIWPHSWNLSDQGRELTLDGVRIESYACSPELDGEGKINGIGTFCHEFAHVLGLPDLYCTNPYASALAPGEWSLMASGNYNNDGRTPPALSSYERMELNWLAHGELSYPLDVTLPPIAENRAARISTERANEYFLLENRQQTGWDTYLPGHGMLIWHIDYNPNIWDRNVVNRDPTHQYVDIVEANSATDHKQGAGFTFPGASNVTSLTPSTRPALKSWSGQEIPLPITEISESATGLISFKVAGGKTPVGCPSGLSVDETTMETASLSWTPAPAATGHRVVIWKEEREDRDTIATYSVPLPETSCLATGLWPGNTYYATVTGFDRYEDGVPSEPIEIMMPDPTFRYTRVEATAPSDCAATEFTARWNPLDGASYYLLTVEYREEGTIETESTGFDGKLIPDGWSSTSNVWNSMAGYFGEAAPALRLSNDGDHLTARDYGRQIRSIRFKLRGSNVSGTPSITLLGRSRTDNVHLAEIPVTSEWVTASISDTETTIPDGITSVSLIFNKSGKTIANIDDVEVGFGNPGEYTPVAGYSELNVGNTRSYRVVGLNPETSYYYRVSASNGSELSLPSERMAVRGQQSSLTAVTTGHNSGIVDVYLPSGILLRRNAPAGTALRGLQSGHYILVPR